MYLTNKHKLFIFTSACWLCVYNKNKRKSNLGKCQQRERSNNLHAAIKFIDVAVYSVEI